jgi:indolepyruvate decarboxylase
VKETTSPQKGLTSQTIIEELNNHMSDEIIAVADVGDCLFSCLDLQVNRFIAPAFYASMGFGVPAGIGVALADPTRRPIVLVGDGAFQMTGVELCTAKKLGQNPLVIVFNDGYYGTLRAFSPEMKSLELPRWDYASLAKTLGCDGGTASTREEVHDLLNRGLESKLPYVVDARITGPPSPLLQRLGELMSKKTKSGAA